MRTVSLFACIALASCAGGPPIDAALANANAVDIRELVQSGAPPIQRILARNEAAREAGVSKTVVAASTGWAALQVAFEQYMAQAAASRAVPK